MVQEIKLLVRDDDEFNELLSRYSCEHQSSIFENAMVIANSAELKFNVNGEENNNYLEINERLFQTENMMRTLNERLLGSSTKGKVGEMGLNEVLTTFLKGYSVTNTEKLDHFGDFVLEYNKNKIMIDSKLYKKTVGKAEIDKLVRDMEEQEIYSGILISTTSTIANKVPPIDIEKREDGKFLVFVSNCSMDCVVGAVKLCELYAGIEKTPDLWNPEISFERIEKSIGKLKKSHSSLMNISESLSQISCEINSTKEKCDIALKEFMLDIMEMTNSLSEEFGNMRENLPYFTTDELEKYIGETAAPCKMNILRETVKLLSGKGVSFHLGNKSIELYNNEKRLGKIKLTTKDAELDLGDIKIKLKDEDKRCIATIIDVYVPINNS